MRIAICDDDPAIRTQLIGYFSNLLLGEKIEEFSAAEDLIASPEKPDILLLDVQMSGISGIEAARMLREAGHDTLIIFITNYIQYAIDGYEVHAYHFLSKPIEEKRFYQVVKGALDLYQKQRNHSITLSGYDKQMRLPVNEICFFETERGHVIVHTTDGRELRCSNTMSRIEQQLQGQDFFRCHTSFLVNLSQIETLTPTDLVLKNGTIIPVSRHRKKELKEMLSFYWSGNYV